MTRKADRRVARVQVYFDNPKLLTALRRSARGDRVSLSRAAERAIERGLSSDPPSQTCGEEALTRVLGDHERRTTRDFSILQELIVELARALFLRLPDAPADNDPLMQVAAQARIERLLSVAAGKIIAGGSQASFRPDRASSPSSVLPPVNSPAAP